MRMTIIQGYKTVEFGSKRDEFPTDQSIEKVACRDKTMCPWQKRFLFLLVRKMMAMTTVRVREN